jgi:hypothetical protein
VVRERGIEFRISNFEFRIKNWILARFFILHSSFEIRNSIFAVSLLLYAANAQANDLTVDRRSIRLDESVTIIISVEDAFATVDSLNVPLKNLVIEGTPLTSSEFSWINGAVVRRKIFRYTARAMQPGPALVGPLVLVGEGGQRETLAPVSLQVLPDVAAESNDPLTILRELVANNRELFFLAAEIDKASATIGEEIVVTWYIYNAAHVQRWQITRVPTLTDFWTEEIDVRSEPPAQELIGNQPMEKVALRRVAIFPLHSGTLTIGGMEVSAEILRRTDISPFGYFEGSLVDVRFPSASLTIDVRPLPAAASSDIVGEISLDCSAPMQRAGGPVTMQATLRGRANLRTAPAPQFERALNGDAEVQELPLTVERAHDGVAMTRRWSYLIFPAASGSMTIPPLVSRTFNPNLSRREELRCAASTLEVQEAVSGGVAPAPSPARAATSLDYKRILPWIVALLAILISIKPIRRSIELRRRVRSIMRSGNIREAVDQLIDPNIVANEASDRGDAYRALRSLLDAIERDRVPEAGAADDIERRVRDLVQSLR